MKSRFGSISLFVFLATALLVFAQSSVAEADPEIELGDEYESHSRNQVVKKEN